MADIFFLITLNFDGAEKEMRGLAGLHNESLGRGLSTEQESAEGSMLPDCLSQVVMCL